MLRTTQFLLLAFALPGPAAVAVAERPAPTIPGEYQDLALSQQELQDITAQVLADRPLLASSPGIKYAAASRNWRQDTADFVFYPHSEKAGLKEAYRVSCSKPHFHPDWTCDEARIRRYLSLATQDFETRVIGPIEVGAALALIEATRAALPQLAGAGEIPDTVRSIKSDDFGTRVVWVDTDDGKRLVVLEGQLAAGGNPSDPGDWIVSLFDPEHPGR